MFEKILNWFTGKNGKKEKNGQYRILIVSGKEDDRQNLRTMLEREGYRLLFAENGEDGFQIAREERPRLILLNMELPTMSGQDLCRMVKGSEDTKNIPVLFLTETSTPRSILEVFESDAENYISKPINRRMLLSQVSSLLEEFASIQKGANDPA